MTRRITALSLLVVALVAGIMLGPTVFGATGPTATSQQSPTDDSQSPSPEPTATSMSAVATPSESPSEPESPTEAESETLDPEEEADLAAGVLSQDVPQSLSGDLQIVGGGSDAPDGDAPVMRIRVEVEQGLEVDGDRFAEFVMTTLNDPRGWGGDGSVRFARTDGEPDIRVVLASPGTVDEMCAPLATNGKWSCGRYGHALLNADRWVFGAEAWTESDGDLTAYRNYLVNHEVGHLLGRPHESCTTPGELAPVMVQQSISMQGCQPNGWPHP